jgi:hypothetical protein
VIEPTIDSVASEIELGHLVKNEVAGAVVAARRAIRQEIDDKRGRQIKQGHQPRQRRHEDEAQQPARNLCMQTAAPNFRIPRLAVHFGIDWRHEHAAFSDSEPAFRTIARVIFVGGADVDIAGVLIDVDDAFRDSINFRRRRRRRHCLATSSRNTETEQITNRQPGQLRTICL